jgi:hypothetical protein
LIHHGQHAAGLNIQSPLKERRKQIPQQCTERNQQTYQNWKIIETKNQPLSQTHTETNRPTKKETPKSLIVPKDAFAIAEVSAKVDLCAAACQDGSAVGAVCGKDEFEGFND